METSSPSLPAIDLPTHVYHQLVHTLTGLLPPPIDDSPEALLTRNHAAIAKVAAPLPINANEADLAAQCIASRTQAEDMLRLLRQHAGDIGLVIRLNAQYGSMVRTSLSVHGRLMRVQALRQKRDATDGAADQDAWALHIAERSMLEALDQDDSPPLPAASPEAASPEAASPEAASSEAASARCHVEAPSEWPGAAPVEPPAADMDHKTTKSVSEDATNSQDMPTETSLSKQRLNRGSRGSGNLDPLEVPRLAIAKAQAAGP